MGTRTHDEDQLHPKPRYDQPVGTTAAEPFGSWMLPAHVRRR